MLKKFKNRISSVVSSVKATATCKKAEGYVDSGVKILIAVVIGALLLGGLYALYNSNIMPTVSEKIQSLFSYTGSITHSGGTN